jgi:endo-1,3-1,4-beta-glycanase ExoK
VTLSFHLGSLGRRAAFLAAASILAMTTGARADDHKGFFDDFNTLDRARWYISDGWSNGTWQNCGWSAKEIGVANGVLNIGFSHNPEANRAYRCGEIQSYSTLGYGTYEARIKTPTGAGLNAAFFTYTGSPHDEIDMEFLLKDPDHVSTTTFVNGKSGDGKKGNGEMTPLPQPSNSGFVDYAMVWTPEKLDFYANRKLIRSIDTPSQIPPHPQKLYLSLWGSDTLTGWMGPFTDPGQPIAMQVDWVGYTPQGAHCLFPQSITCP